MSQLRVARGQQSLASKVHVECAFKIDARTPLRFCLNDWFRPYVESLLAVAPEVTKKACPCHPGLAALDFPHPIIAPWARCDGPSVAQHSSRGILPLNPLRNDCVRPAEKGRLSWRVLNWLGMTADRLLI
jgi:hypothetical protein